MRRALAVILLFAVTICCRPHAAFSQQFDFYHGTDYESAKWIYENRLTPYTLLQLGIQGANQGAPWTNYTDFGKGFYTHPPGQLELARDWAIRSACGKCQPGQQVAYWGVVIFHVDPSLLQPIDVGAPERALYFTAKRFSPWNAPWSNRYPGTKMTWLEFVEYNRGFYSIMRPGDYDWSPAYAWIQGPIWVPRDSGIDYGGPIFDERILQRNWLQQGLDQVLNDGRTKRELRSGAVNCSECGGKKQVPAPGAAEPQSYYIYVLNISNGSVWIGQEATRQTTPRCRFAGGGTCEGGGNLPAEVLWRSAQGFRTAEEAKAAWCQELRGKQIEDWSAIAGDRKAAVFGGKYWIGLAPGCP